MADTGKEKIEEMPIIESGSDDDLPNEKLIISEQMPIEGNLITIVKLSINFNYYPQQLNRNRKCS